MKEESPINDEYLDRLYAKNEFSGFDRSEATKIIRRLIKDLRSTIVVAQTLATTVMEMDEEILRTSFEDGA